MAKEKSTKKESSVPQTLEVRIADQPLSAIWKIQKDGKEGFSTGSLGWGCNGKIIINGTRCQVSCNIIVIGSKPEGGDKDGKKK